MVFGKGRAPHKNKWYYNGDKIEMVDHYKYLGVIFHRNGGFSKHWQETKKKTKAAVLISTLRSTKTNDIDIILRLFYSLVSSIPMYGFAIWGANYLEEIEKLQTQFLRRILG
ncbi:unnamed protein product, partial [Allacma fusca]